MGTSRWGQQDSNVAVWQGLRGVAGLAQMTSVVTPVWLWASVAPLSWTRAARVTVQSVVVTGAPYLSIREPLRRVRGRTGLFMILK